MKAIYMFGILALVAMGISSGCSENYDLSMKPVKNALELSVDGHTTAFSVDYGAEPNNSIPVQVNSNTLWKVDIDAEGGWCSADKLTGRGEEVFNIRILENINKERNAFVTVYMVDASGEKIASTEGQNSSITMTLKQAVSDVRLSPASFENFKASGNESKLVSIEANVAWILRVTYEGENPTEFINITPIDNSMTIGSDGSWSGTGRAQFNMTLTDNRSATERRAFINLSSAAGSYTVEIIQNKSEYTFNVSPTEQQIVGPEGGTIEFGIYSLSDWYIESANDLKDWISFLPAEGSASPNRVTTKATIAPNTKGTARTAHIEFKAKQEQYGMMSVDIVQRAFETAFSLSRNDEVDVVRENGGELSIELDTRFRWEASAPSWLVVNPKSGVPSTSISRITVTVDPNKSNVNRTGSVMITPLPTEFAPGVIIDPLMLGFEPLHIDVTQFGGREAAISVPWLRDDYTNTSATIEFNFYSPFYNIVEVGLEWGREDSDVRQTIVSTPENGTDATATFYLTGLDPATKYVARGFVKDEEGNVKNGNWSFPFTTGGQFPGATDNPTPTR